jgi:hypothetical protein
LKSAEIREITLSLNIKLRISKVSNEVEIAMTWLINTQYKKSGRWTN